MGHRENENSPGARKADPEDTNMNGFIAVHRKIFKNPIIKPRRPYSKFEAWHLLMMRANYSNHRVPLGTEVIHASRGEVITSQKKLGLKFGWGNTKVRNFLKLLENDTMIVLKTTPSLTRITLCNYESYQIQQTDSKPKATQPQHRAKPQTNTKNKKNKDNKNNKIEIKSLESIDQNFIKSLQDKNLDVDVDSEFVRFKDYISANGKTYKDYRAAFRNWISNSYTQKTDKIRNERFRESQKIKKLPEYSDDEIATDEERKKAIDEERKKAIDSVKRLGRKFSQ